MSLKAVEIENVSFKMNGMSILEDINFSIDDRDFIAIIGPNGGGKTTLLKIILGLIKPTTGRVRVYGRSPTKSSDLIGYLPQHVSFDPAFPINVFETTLSGRYHGILKPYTDNDREKVLNVLDEVDMLDMKNRQISQLSGGQMQRVFIARALIREPKLLLLDEPMASIDPEMQSSFYPLLTRLREKMTIVLVSHDVGAVSSHVDRIACLNQRLYYHGPVEEAADGLEEVYKCPLELISHGIPHRVLKKH
jgi:zinc transport system ATP-binding protein